MFDKKLFHLIEQSISYKYGPLRVHLVLIDVMVINETFFTKFCKNGHFKLHSSVCKIFVAPIAKILQESKRQFIYLSNTANIILLSYNIENIILLSYTLLNLLAVKHDNPL